jgi:hypothetical protein
VTEIQENCGPSCRRAQLKRILTPQSVACAATGGYRAENVHRNSEKAAAIHSRLHAHTWRSTKRDLYVIVGVLVQMLLDAEEHEKDAH